MKEVTRSGRKCYNNQEEDICLWSFSYQTSKPFGSIDHSKTKVIVCKTELRELYWTDSVCIVCYTASNATDFLKNPR